MFTFVVEMEYKQMEFKSQYLGNDGAATKNADDIKIWDELFQRLYAGQLRKKFEFLDVNKMDTMNEIRK